MLETPFGKINILVDGVAIHYEAKPNVFWSCKMKRLK